MTVSHAAHPLEEQVLSPGAFSDIPGSYVNSRRERGRKVCAFVCLIGWFDSYTKHGIEKNTLWQ